MRTLWTEDYKKKTLLIYDQNNIVCKIDIQLDATNIGQYVSNITLLSANRTHIYLIIFCSAHIQRSLGLTNLETDVIFSEHRSELFI
jgi:hypothetical protein